MKQFTGGTVRITFIVILVFSVLTVGAQGQRKTSFVFSPQEAIELTNQLITGINPGNPENSYMTPFMREKISWIYIQESLGKLKLKLVTNENGVLPETALMHSFYEGNVPVIEIVANRLLMLIRVQQNVAKGYNQMQKNTFALGLVHEAVHLENPPQFFTTKDAAATRNEELRTWRKVDELAVAGLLKGGQPLDIDYPGFHNIFLKCGYKGPCPAFDKY
jgi:hypothetical protein